MTIEKNSQRRPILRALALLLLTMLCGCASADRVPRSAVNLPPAPDFMQPVASVAPPAGEDARTALAVCRKVDLPDANGRLVQSRGWYLGLRRRYANAPL